MKPIQCLLFIICVFVNLHVSLGISLLDAYRSESNVRRRLANQNNDFRPVLHLRGLDDWKHLEGSQLTENQFLDENGIVYDMDPRASDRPSMVKSNSQQGRGSTSSSVEVVEYVDPFDCHCCTKSVKPVIHVLCGECQTRLCLTCFRLGAELGPHLRSHPYEIVDPQVDRIQTHPDGWSQNKEVKLLNSAQKYKLSNWEEVAKEAKLNETPAAVQTYFEKVFINGTIGQYAIHQAEWVEKKEALAREDRLESVLESNKDPIGKLLLITDALRDVKTIVSETDSIDHVREKVRQITHVHIENYTEKIREQDEIEKQQMKLNERPSRKRKASTNSESPVEEVAESKEFKTPQVASAKSTVTPKSKYQDLYEMSGLEPENESDDDENSSEPIPTVLVVKKVEMRGRTNLRSEIREKKSPSKSSSAPKTRNLKTKVSAQRRKLRSSKKPESGSKSKYKRIQTQSSSSDEEDDKSEVDSNDDDNETSRDSEDLDKEQTTSESEEDTDTSPGTSKNASSKKKESKKKYKKRAPILSKKQRRLLSYKRKINRDMRKKEKRLVELNDICPPDEILRLRLERTHLHLDIETPIAEKPRMRQDDLQMIAFNQNREDLDVEWFNDAEQLISRLLIHPNPTRDQLIDVENEVKFARIEMYNRILRMRRANRRMFMEHDKITEFFNFMMQMTVDKRPMTEVLADRSEEDIVVKSLQQCLTKEEYQDFLKLWQKNDDLIERVKKLQEMQKNGETTVKPGFEKMMTNLMKKKRNVKKMDAETKRKAQLRWQAYKRWQQKQAAQY
ncbi:hypothetical protein WR25_16065 [Diploscapter pachys]|uniref:C2H2-type domain-containing protein n=1 Tax=Diploscapter pachys TaxID=2018661 RepID=A0A2A2KJ28_9BILA|nr:hypothetical protein WR25_16065 [Diploscapter pachys]